MNSDRGFSLIEMLFIVAFLGIVAAIATPVMTEVVDGMRLGATARELERELQTARLKSVQTNRNLRVRTNCPAVGQYRMLEVIGTASAPDARDTAANRCSDTDYPFPPTHPPNVATPPNFDGPVRRVYQGVTLGTAVIEFHPDGTAYQVSSGVATRITAATGVPIVLTKRTLTKTVRVNGFGKIQLQ